MEIKRNIFESPAKMPPAYEPVAVKTPEPGVNDRTMPGHAKTENHVVHARSPRVGDN